MPPKTIKRTPSHPVSAPVTTFSSAWAVKTPNGPAMAVPDWRAVTVEAAPAAAPKPMASCSIGPEKFNATAAALAASRSRAIPTRPRA